MMASNFMSKLLPTGAGSPSVYEALQQNDESLDGTDIENRAGMALDEENLGQQFGHYDLDQGDMSEPGRSQAAPGQEPTFVAVNNKQRRSSSSRSGRRRRDAELIDRPRWMRTSPGLHGADEGDDEVPASLLIEGGEEAGAIAADDGHAQVAMHASVIPGPSTTKTRAQWEATKMRQRLHNDLPSAATQQRATGTTRTALSMIDPRERAMWRWANVENLDNFLKDVYDYFLGNGIWCIILRRVLSLLTLAFVVSFSIFLSMCVDYKKVPHSNTMSQILIPQCTKKMSSSANVFIWLFVLFWVAKVFEYILDLRRLRHMQDFYSYLLNIPDPDLQTISWQEVVSRLMSLRDSNPVTADGIGPRQRRFMGSQSKQRMDAHDIANRLMRKENYLIALFNKDILDLTLPIPFLRNRQFFSKTLEWNLSLCILDYVFNEQGQLRPLFLRDTHRRALSDGLRRRFLFAGVMNVICAPFIVIYLLMLYFFRYFTEFQKNPSQIGSRQYTPLAEWKFREFNELRHLFKRRTNMSYPFASRYLDQFPKDKTVQLSSFVAFIAGALASVLALASVIDPELFLGFEITPERTVLFYLGVFGTVWAIARGVVPEESLVFDPEFSLNNVIEYTHYLPAHWRGRLHSDEVRKEVSQLYQMKVIIFLEELLSLVFTPFILWFSLPKCSDQLVDFFREFTIHVDGLGYVCSFAVFDFKKGGNNLVQRHAQRVKEGNLRDDYYSTKDGKMLASYYGFLDNYAHNPRGGGAVMQPGVKRHFYPPPVFPGLGSAAFGEEMSGNARTRLDKLGGTLGRPATSIHVASPRHRTARGVPVGGPPGSSMPSLLLDPDHQPLVQSTQRLPRRTARSRYLSPNSALAEEPGEGNGSTEPEPQQGVDETSGNLTSGLGEDDNLGESWKTTRAAARDNEDDDEVDDPSGDKGAGVLGLLYQFQRAQTEGRGAGVSI